MQKRHYHRRPRRADAPEEILELVVGEPAHGGACVARDASGRVVFVRHALPGERVRARVTSTRNTLAWADAVEILEPSSDRVESVWPQAGPGGVGGGELAHVRPAAQRAWKETVIRRQLRRVGGPDLAAAIDEAGGVRVDPAPGDETGPLLHRRTRIEVVVDHAGRAGMHRYRGKEIIALESMPLAVESIEALGLWGGDSAWAERWRPGDRVRIVAPDGLSPVVVAPKATYNPLGERLDAERLLWHVDVAGETLEYRVRPNGFWQTHLEGASVLANAVLEAVGPQAGDRIIELFSGAGLFTAPLAERIGASGRLVSLEGDEGAVADAAENTARFGWVDAYVGGVDAEGVGQLVGELDGSPDAVVLDPPRAGAGRDACRAIAGVGARRIVLVSCDPAAGARDLREFFEAGYSVESFRAWDLFPHTHHVESVATLVREER